MLLAVLAGQHAGVLVVDGVFLLRARVRELWTVAGYLKVSPAECERARHRDHSVLGSVAEVERRHLSGQVLYRNDVAPETAADVLVDNENPTLPGSCALAQFVAWVTTLGTERWCRALRWRARTPTRPGPARGAAGAAAVLQGRQEQRGDALLDGGPVGQLGLGAAAPLPGSVTD